MNFPEWRINISITFLSRLFYRFLGGMITHFIFSNKILKSRYSINRVMLSTQKFQAVFKAYFLAILLVLIVASRYGKELLEWMFLKLYQFFIERGGNEGMK
jgi:hypothetical protein